MGRAPPLQFFEKPDQNQIRLRQGGGARAGSGPPRMGSNAPEGLLCKASGKRSADFYGAAGRKSNGIFTDDSSDGTVAAEGQGRNPADFSLEI